MAAASIRGAGAATRGDRTSLGAGRVPLPLGATHVMDAGRRVLKETRGRRPGGGGQDPLRHHRRVLKILEVMEVCVDRSSQRHGDPADGGHAAGDGGGARWGRRLRGGPDGQPARGVRGGAARQRGGPVRALRDDDQPDRGPRKHEPRGRGAPARGRPHLRLRGRGPGHALRRRRSGRSPAKTASSRPRDRARRRAARGRPLPAVEAAVPREHPQHRGRQGLPARRLRGGGRGGERMGLKVHLDGARLFNAQAATGIPASEWCEHADTVSVCSSKGPRGARRIVACRETRRPFARPGGRARLSAGGCGRPASSPPAPSTPSRTT